MPEPSSIPPSLSVANVPSLADVLTQAKSLPLLEQLALLRADQQRRWLLGQPVRVEDYLAALPALRAREDVVLDLVRNEVLLREQAGDTPTLEEYLGRFSQLETALRRSFAWHKSLPPPVPVRLYAAARVHGRCAKVVREDTALAPAERERLAEAYAAKAVALLREAQAAGFFRTPQAAERLPHDKDLDALRGRADFKKLVTELQ
jgi:hypothetical protein